MSRKTKKKLSKHEADLTKSTIDSNTETIKPDNFIEDKKKEFNLTEQGKATKLTAKKNLGIVFSETDDEVDDGGWLCL